jgi:hypothetical protein
MTPTWTPAQIEAMLALDGGTQRLVKPEEIAAMKEAARPAVSKGCICTNNHQPDSEGLIFTSPACAIHGLKSRYIESTGRNQRDARTVGATHRTNRDR